MRQQPELKKNNHLISCADLSADELKKLLKLMGILKDARKHGIRLPLLKDKTLGMIFEITSTRTRISFETAMTELGGHAQFLSMKNLHVGEGHETMRDTAEVISRMVDGVIMRCESHDYMEEFAKYSFVPVFNGMTMAGHPTQALADVFTMMEHLPDKPFNEMVIQYMGDNNDEYDELVPVQRELMWMSARLGMTYIACAPKEMWVCEKDRKRFEELAKEENSGAKLICTDDPYEYIKQVDFTVSDSFWMGFADGSEDAVRRHNLLYPKYSVDQKLVDAGKPSLGVLHCLPGMRDEEITSEVWDGPNSLLFEEAENRLSAQRAICVWFMYSGKQDEKLEKQYMEKVESFLAGCDRSVPSAQYIEK